MPETPRSAKARAIVRSHDGAVMAVWNDNGTIDQTIVMQAADDFRVPIPSSSLVVYPLRGVWDSRALSEDWSDVLSSTKTGSMMLRRPPGSAAVMYLSSVAPLAPRVIDGSYPGRAKRSPRSVALTARRFTKSYKQTA